MGVLNVLDAKFSVLYNKLKFLSSPALRLIVLGLGIKSPSSCNISEPKLPVISNPIPRELLLIPLKKTKEEADRAVRLV